MSDRIFGAIGHTVVRFRWLVIAGWIALIVVTSATLPSLSSEINNDNSQFLPASTPSSQAATLAAPIFGSFNDTSIVTIIAGRSSGTIGTGDEAALLSLAAKARSLPRVTSVRLAAVSADGQAVQILVRAHINGADITDQNTLITALQGAIARDHAPPGLQVGLAGQVATNVANQESSQRTGNETQLFSFIFIIVLLLAIFRSVLAPLITLLPAGLSLVVSTRLIGELGAHGLKISEITELLLIILILGAGTDYGLFLVFRVREEIRRGLDGPTAVEHAVVRVGESITASAGTVILALLSLLLASFGIYHDLGVPLAVGVAVILLAGLTLLPALLAIFGRAAFWPTRVAAGEARDGAWGKVAARLIRRPALTLSIGVLLFGGLAIGALGYHSSGFGGAANAPKGSSAATGNALLARHFPQSNANPANLVFRYATPIWDDPSAVARTGASLAASNRFSSLLGPLTPNGTTLSPAAYARLHTLLGNPLKLTPTPAPAVANEGISLADYNAYRSSSVLVSADGHTIQFEAALRAGGQQSTGALNATPRIRAAVLAAARAGGR